MVLQVLGESDLQPGEQRVTILVGPNGSGKSNHLRMVAEQIRYSHKLLIIANTAFDRFKGIRGIRRVSASRGMNSPKVILKRAVAETLDQAGSRFFQIGTTLEYCGYEPRLGFVLQYPENPDWKMSGRDGLPEAVEGDFGFALDFLQRHDRELIWIDQREDAFRFSRARQFAAVLRNEQALRSAGYLVDINVVLQKPDGPVIELGDASSGELSLIASLVFLSAWAEEESVILIDEPENSLHPSWQREYVEKVLGALNYHGATVVIATHAPLIVTGALAKLPSVLSVWQIDRGELRRLDLADTKESAANIEGVLWRAFDVITPANHFVSEQITELISDLEHSRRSRDEVLGIVAEMDKQSFDAQQQDFFGAVRELIIKVDQAKPSGRTRE